MKVRFRLRSAFVLLPALLVVSALVGPISVHAQSSGSTDIGVTIVTVVVNNVNKGANPDWSGPYYQMDYSFSAPYSPSESGNFGAGQGCSNCWIYGYTFPSNTTGSFSLSLYDNQNCCFGGMPGVNINGGSNSITVYVSGANAQNAGGQCILGWSQTCPYTIDISGSGSRTASVSMTVNVQSALEYEASLRQQEYEQYSTMASDLSNGVVAQTCYNDWEAGISQLNSELVPLMLAPFSFEFFPESAVDAMIELALHFGEFTAVDAMYNGANFMSQQRTSFQIGSFSNMGLTDCGNFETTWTYAGTSGSNLAYALQSVIGAIGSELNDLHNNNIGYGYGTGVLADFGSQQNQISNAYSAVSSVINNLQPIADGQEYADCYGGLSSPIISCQPYAQYLINSFLQPILNYLNADSSYISSASGLLSAAAGTLGASLSTSNSEIGVAYSATVSGYGGLPPMSHRISLYSGTLPSGLGLAAGSPASISGTPTSSAVSSSFQLQVTDGAGDIGLPYEFINVAPHVQVATSSLPIADANGGYSGTLSAWYGYGPYSWAVASGSSLPAGLSLSSSGVVSGTPSSVGNYTFTVKVTDSSGGTAQAPVKLEVVNWQSLSASASPVQLGYWLRRVCYPNPNGGITCVVVAINLGDTSTITAYYSYDGTGKAVTVAISASQGSLNSSSCTTTNGSCSVTLTDNTPGTSTATISYGGVRATATVDYCSSSSPC